MKLCGLWNEKESVSEPAIVALDPAGTIQYLYSGGTDFADRPQEESLLYILDKVGAEDGGAHGEGERDEPEIRVSAEEAVTETLRPERPAITLEQLKPYLQGVYFTTISMNKKLVDEGLQEENIAKRVGSYKELIAGYSAALRKTIEAKDG